MAKQNNYSITDIATLKADMRWIKEKLEEMSDTLKNIKLCTDGHDDKITKIEGRCGILEVWCTGHDKAEVDKRNMKIKRKELSNAKLALMLSAAGIIAAVVFFVLGKIFS
jgi:hypothetical protein